MRRYLIFAVVSLALLLSSISSSSVAVAFPVIISDMNTSLVLAGWILTSYQLVQTIVMPLGGKISELVSRRISFIVYTLLFSVGSVLCALAPNVYLLIGARIIQAAGGGGFMPCAAGIVADEFPEARQRYIGLFSSIFPIGAIIGPNLGGWMVEAFGWRSIFWFNVPLGIMVLALSRFLLSKGHAGKTTGRSIDFVGAGLLFASISAFTIGLTELGSPETGISWVLVSFFLGLGVGLIVPFVLWERRVKEPIVDFELLKRAPFLAANMYNFIYGMCALGIFSLIPYYAVSIYDMTTFESGILLTPRSVGMMAASTITSFYLVKWGYRKPILAGTIFVIAAVILLALQPGAVEILGVKIEAIPLLFIIVGFAGLGHGTCTPAANNACIELMPDKVATIVGLRGMFRILGSSFGISIATVVIHVIGNVESAFFYVLLASAALLVISVPTIFVMPASPEMRVTVNSAKL
jgi:EmrB/QacA subfamily drug resistance transporter